MTDLGGLYFNMQHIGEKRQSYISNLLSKVYELELLIGRSFDEIVSLFAAGYTLEAPKKPMKFADLIKMLESEE